MLSRDADSQRADLTYGGGDRIGVMLPLPLSETYDYRVPAGMTLAAGILC